jgi:hypothetical protein
LKPQIYLPDMIKQYLKEQIGRFVGVYNLKLKSVFDNIDIEAEEHGDNFFNDALQYSHPDGIDPSDIAEEAMDRAYKHWDLLNHGRYVLLASWHVALYEAFEQQVRNYVFKELSHEFYLKINHIFSRFGDLKKILILYGIDLSLLKGLKQIEHLRLLCNVVKHGEGGSAKELRKKRPDLIKSLDNIELLELYGSSLLDEVLSISDITLIEFGKAIEDFWDSFPERSFCEDPDKVVKLLNK